MTIVTATMAVGCSGPLAPKEKEAEAQVLGCWLSGSLPGQSGQSGMFYPSGNVLVDGFYQQEGLNLVYTFGVSPRGFYFIDSSPNAYAMPQVTNPLGPDGTVVFGVNLTSQQLQKQPNGSTVIAIMAHEFGHIMQFKYGGVGAGKRAELHADFMAGWYLRMRGTYAWTNLSSALRIFYDLGDYAFNSPQHHGTPDERLAAAAAGFNSTAPDALQAYNAGLQSIH